MLFGSDSRKNDDSWKSPAGGRITADRTGTDGTPRSDVIMLIKVDNKSKAINVTPIYRDTLLDVSGKGKDFQKVNKAYADLGPKKAVKALEKNLNIKIDGYVATNFKGVANVIDSLGGVTVNIENENTFDVIKKDKGLNNVIDAANVYIREMNRIYHTDTPYLKNAGKQVLTGLQAVAYGRVRYTEGSDMKRSVRQRRVLSAMSAKFKKQSKIKKAEIMLVVMNNIDTDINPGKFSSLFLKNADYKLASLKKMKGFPYYKAPHIMTKTSAKGSAVVVPCDLQKNVNKLHKSFYGQKKYKPSKTVKKYSKKIVKITKLNYKSRDKALDNKY